MDKYLRVLVYILPIIVVGLFFKYVLRKKGNDNQVSEDNSQIKVLKYPFVYRIIPFVVSIFILSTVTILTFIQGIDEIGHI